MWSQCVGVLALVSLATACRPSVTTVSGTHAPAAVCSGALIFSEEFNTFDLEKWQHENTLTGGGSWQFQYYNNNRTNSFVHSGRLFIRPSLTTDKFGNAFLTSGRLEIDGGTPADRCTNTRDTGCDRQASANQIMNPIMSASLRTANSFSFRYGRVEVRAKMPAGDWLWPGISLMPAHNAYGSWPASGLISLAESRGNRNLFAPNGAHIGTQSVASTLRYGPAREFFTNSRTHWIRRDPSGFDNAFNIYQMEWTPDFLSFSINGQEIGRVTPGAGGFWNLGGFNQNRGLSNPWRYGTKMAPFDEKFYIVMNVAVGGVDGYFPDDAFNPTRKPWWNGGSTAARDFWNGRTGWLQTWNLNANDGQDASLQVDYVHVWAL